MSHDQNLECLLDGGARAERAAEMQELGHTSLLALEAGDGRAVMRFRRDAPTRERLAGVVAAESHCCPFLSLELHETGESVTLTISTAPGGEPLVRALAGAFAGGWALDP